MIQALRRKFVFTAMLAVTVLLIFLLGTICIVNASLSSRQSDRLLASLAITEQQPMQKPPDAPDRPGHIFDSEPTSNNRLSAVYFTVRTDRNGEILTVDVDRIASISAQDAEAYARKVMQSGKTEGRDGSFKFCVITRNDGIGKTYIFLDISSQILSVLRISLLSALIGLLCWGLMFLLVILLSKKAIYPLAANIERQKQFVTDAGHEIKTPLAVILANTEAMELHNGENKWSKNIREQVTRLSGLMQNLLTLSKIDESNIRVSKELVSLSELVKNTADMFAEAMELKGLQCEMHLSPDIFGSVNKELWMRLCSILFDNAVKYSPENGKIDVQLFKNDKNIHFEIQNECTEFPACPPDKLFDRFYRADSARTQNGGGYGIGLSAAQSIAKIHGGMVSAAYKDGNQIVFTVKIEKHSK